MGRKIKGVHLSRGSSNLEALGVEGTGIFGLVDLVGADLDAVEEVTVGSNVAGKDHVVLEGEDVVDGFLTGPNVLDELTLVAGVTLEQINLQQLVGLRSAVTLKLEAEVLANINSLTLSRVLNIKTEATLQVVGVVDSGIIDVILSDGTVSVGVARGAGDLEGG